MTVYKWIPISESGDGRRERSHITKRDRNKLMGLILSFGWNCWLNGDQMYPWEDAEHDNSKRKLDEFIDQMSDV